MPTHSDFEGFKMRTPDTRGHTSRHVLRLLVVVTCFLAVLVGMTAPAEAAKRVGHPTQGLRHQGHDLQRHPSLVGSPQDQVVPGAVLDQPVDEARPRTSAFHARTVRIAHLKANHRYYFRVRVIGPSPSQCLQPQGRLLGRHPPADQQARRRRSPACRRPPCAKPTLPVPPAADAPGADPDADPDADADAPDSDPAGSDPDAPDADPADPDADAPGPDADAEPLTTRAGSTSAPPSPRLRTSAPASSGRRPPRWRPRRTARFKNGVLTITQDLKDRVVNGTSTSPPTT